MRAHVSAVAAAFVGLTAAGCFLPLSTSAPQSATTLGKSRFGFIGYTEFPSTNLSWTAQNNAPIFPGLAGAVQAGYGLSDSLDLELGIEGMMYLFILPLPTGAHGGVRYQLYEGDNFDWALATRVGLSSFSWSNSTDGRQSMTNLYWMASAVAQLKAIPVFRPSLAWSLYPSLVDYRLSSGNGSFPAFTTSVALNLTLDMGPIDLTPSAGLVASWTRVAPEPSIFPQVGLSLAFRRAKPKPEAPSLPPAAPPPSSAPTAPTETEAAPPPTAP